MKHKEKLCEPQLNSLNKKEAQESGEKGTKALSFSAVQFPKGLPFGFLCLTTIWILFSASQG